jgi:two-component system NtrC family sensor kinase
MENQRLLSNAYYKHLHRRLVMIVVLVSFAPMILAIGVILDQFRISYREKIHAHLEELVLKHKQGIDTFLTEKLGDIRFVADAFDCDQLSDPTFLKDMLMLLRQEYGGVFEDLGLIDGSGRQVAYAGPYLLTEADYSQADWFRKAIAAPYFISDVFLGLRGTPHFIVAVRKEFGGSACLLRATINFAAFNTLVENLRVGKTGFAYILNRDVEFQTKPLYEIPLSKDGYFANFLKKGAGASRPVHIVEREDRKGTPSIFVSAFLKDNQWLLVFQQSTEDAFSDISRTLNIAILIFIAGAIAIVAMAHILSGRMVARIAVADREKEMMNQQVIETGKLASVGELAAGIAHEINNPVAIMVEEAGWIQDLLEDEDLAQTENKAEFERALQQIKNQGKRCKEITHKLLSFARKTDSRVEDVVINDLLEEMVSLSAQRARYSKVTIETDLAEGLPPLHVSQTELQQVFLNLINNALDAMNQTGGSLKISTCQADDKIVIEVADTGPGIPRANLARIFDPFFTTKPVGKGTGLGLSICYGIIKKMSGEIDVNSVLDMGTTFRIQLPVQPQSEGPAQPAA